MALKISDTASSANYIRFGGAANTAPFNMQAAGSFSLIFKFNATPANNNRIVCKNISAAGTQSWGVGYSNITGSLYLTWYQPANSTVTSVGAKSTDTWYQMVGSFDPAASAGNKFRLYLNSEELADGSFVPLGTAVTSAPQTNSVAFAIGKDQQTGTNGAPIDVAEFEWTSTPVTPGNAIAMYNGGLFKRFVDIGITQSNYWPMTDTAATTTIDDTVGSLDGTGSGITAAASHPPMWYLQPEGGGFRYQRAAKMRGLSIPRLRRVAR